MPHDSEHLSIVNASPEENAAIRICPLSKQFLPDAAAVHAEAFRGYPNVRLGPWYMRRMLHEFAATGRGVGLAAADEHQRVLGYLAGIELDSLPRFNRRMLLPATISLALHPWMFCDGFILKIVVSRLRLLLFGEEAPMAEPDLPKPTIGLASIAVADRARGRNIGTQLLEGFERESWKLGMASMRLSVLPDNMSARRLYEKCGWTPHPVQSATQQAMYYSKLLKRVETMSEETP